MSEFLIGFFALTGGMFWILWFVGWVGEKLGLNKDL